MLDENIYKVINGNSLEVLDTLPENSIGSIVCDPPYELGFMGKSWDSTGIAYNVELWKKALRVLKPGGYLLAFGGSRTFHRIACAIEGGGFEIRDTIMWLYGSGFPKSLNVGVGVDKKRGVESQVVGIGKSGSANTHTRCMNSQTQSGEDVFGGDYEIKKSNNEWSGWGTCLKPAFEPIIVARKPLVGTVVDNCLEYGVGAINLDECRIPLEEGYKSPIRSETSQQHCNERKGQTQCDLGNKGDYAGANPTGRFPANVILTYDKTDAQEVCGGMPYTKSTGGSGEALTTKCFNNVKCGSTINTGANLGGLGDEGSAARYFYCAKASKKDRDDGLDMFESKKCSMMASNDNMDENGNFTGMLAGRETMRKNVHPTVKPTELMQYLVRLVTPKGQTVLDIFNGSGSTGKAVAFENRERNANYKYIGIELSQEYVEISKARIDYAINQFEYEQLKLIEEQKKENEKKGQMSLFDFDYDD